MRISLAVLLMSATLSAQPPLSFEVASVKPEPWTGKGGVYVMVRGNTLLGEHTDLFSLVEFAYGLEDFQLSGGPGWVKHGVLDQSELFQVVAKPAGEVVPSEEQFRAMLQALLAERFQLRVHHVSKDVPVFDLVVGKSGSKLRESPADSKFAMGISGGGRGKPIHVEATHVPLVNLVGQLGMYAGRPVIDKTGLTGFYDFTMEWEPNGLASADSSGPSVFTAVQGLGLRLAPGTAPFDTVVIDSAERPSGN